MTLLADAEKEYLECEKKWVFAMLMMVGGYLGAFTYMLRGKVFCNAQTGNILLLSMALGQGEWLHAAYYLIPMAAYLGGSMLSEFLPKSVRRYRVRWDTMLVGFELVVVLILGFIPESAPYQISQVLVNFICSMQYNTFRQAQRIPMATTFCTNHVRQTGIF
ncbi:Permease [Lachnospiraceae bacterium TWA4]|nr:Permease [Lachnospiraceae bacterium TWA4]